MKTHPNGHNKQESEPFPTSGLVTDRDLDLMLSELELLTAQELEAKLKVPSGWAYRAKKRGLPYINVDDRKVRFQLRAVLRFIETRKRNYPKSSH